ncbi:PLP-dependent transferase [Viridothelium virens]|uniref:PLP-dependent transferase n=1 Tax=Viridothelium virens TaxID=1048519 RepID=A0A6A6H0D6_VIRVR|nr:PLP-dependent transferase [Viridothelium virens]
MTDLKKEDEDAVASTPFGREMRKFFPFADDYMHLNHASWGALPTAILNVQRQFQDATERRLDPFIRYELPTHIVAARRALAALLHAPLNSTVMIQNATTGFSVVLRNLPWSAGDTIFYFSTIYGGCEKSIQFTAETTPATAQRIPLAYPLSDAALLAQLHSAITATRAQGLRPRLAVFDTVSSMPGVRMPFEALTALCRAEGVLSFVDGAHGAGHLPLNLARLDPDFFVSNAHKWLMVPRPCAVLYVREALQPLIRSSVPTSHGFRPSVRPGEKVRGSPMPVDETETAFVANFAFVGTLDTSPYICVPAAVEWRARLRWEGKTGEEAVVAYGMWLARAVGRRVAEMWGTEVLSNGGCEGQEGRDTLGECCMSNVRLPLDVASIAEKWNRGDVDSTGAKLVIWMGKTGLEYGTFVQTYYYVGALWWRISAQIYLELKDFEWGANVIEKMCDRAEKGEWMGKERSKL